MTSSLHTLKRVGAHKSKRVGRGQSSGKGKTSGRGTKGQNSRSGRKKRPELRDIIKKLPKRRGYGKNRSHTVNTRLAPHAAVSLDRLSKLFPTGGDVSPASFASSQFIRGRGAKRPMIKIVSGGDITQPFKISGISVSASAKHAIEKAGGSVSK